MKRFLTFVLCTLSLCTFTVQANDFLEKQSHYQVKTEQTDVIKLKLPVYSVGFYSYFIKDNKYLSSYVYFTYNDGTKDVTKKLFNFNGEMTNDGPSHNDDVTYGYAYVSCSNDDIGVLEITNLSNDQRVLVAHDGVKRQYTVTKNREMENDNDYVTWLEINWFPPAYLKDTTFSVGVDIYISTKNHGPEDYNYHKYGDNWVLRKNLRYSTNLIDAQLFEPYFHAVNEQGIAGYGYAAIPYSLFYEPISYHTSFNSTEFTTSQRMDNIYVPTTDTIQPNFTATFKVWYDKEHGIEEVQTTQPVAIPAYHRIHNFLADEERDTTGTYTGNTVLRWDIKNPQLADIMEGDFFEIQRALKKDFSDAESLDLISLQRGAKHDTYTYVDENRATWTGKAQTTMDTLDRHVKAFQENYHLTGADNQPLATLTLILQANKVISPGVPVYYRIRRASSSVWGWNEEFSRSYAMTKHNFLAPLADKQENYTLDKEFEENHKVHFAIALDNKPIQYDMPQIDDCTLSYEITEDLRDEVQLHFNVQAVNTDGLMAQVHAVVYDKDGEVAIPEWTITTSQTVKVPNAGRLSISHRCTQCENWEIRNYLIEGETELAITEEKLNYMFPVYRIQSLDLKPAESELKRDIDARMASLAPELKQQLLAQMITNLNSQIGRCMWDRTARLVLIRSSQENPDIVQEFIIPQDSIKRQPDGSWTAFYTDIANRACTHYTYAVRIDQSSADLHVQDSIDLQPRVINGDNLYYDDAATITSFTATQGATATELKRGVLLNWTPSSEAVDEYLLLRKEAGSTDAADTLYTGLDVTYLDLTAVPDVHYDYTIVAKYECNGKHSENNASTEGWRTPYGEIRGAILMPDNSGIAGVTVALQKEGTVVRTLITGANGAFRFDSLLYDITGSTEYVIVPTATYGTFRYNNTSAGTAAITLSKDNAVAMGINFENADGVRLTGRALYDLSTIPVAGAMFVLNGDTVRRNGVPLTTGVDGNFELTLTKAQPYTLQIIKPGHHFVNEGYLEVTTGERTFALSKALDGVRFYDQTKVRLVGRVAGGIDQRDLPAAFGLGKNNLGDDLTLVLQLEGDNTAHFVHDPQDLTRDTLMNTFAHKVYSTDPLSAVKERTVGTTSMLTEKKRITIHPDPKTGEYAVDLYPVKYKVIQATATGYATLFASGQASETFDLTTATLQSFDPKRGTDSVHYNAVYDRIYRSPVQVSVIQRIYGMKRSGLGEPTMEVGGVTPDQTKKIPLYTEAEDGTINYTLGYPLFVNKRKYQFELFAFEDYYMNNTKSGALDRVPQRGGKVTIHNGLHNVSNHTDYILDQQGKNSDVWLTVDYLDVTNKGLAALRTVTAALNVEGNMVETDVFRAFVIGNAEQATSIRSTDAGITLLDIVRDPGGAGSSAYVESGTTYKYAYNESDYFNLGVNLTPTWTAKISQDIGIITALSSYIGANYEAKRQLAFTIPLTYEDKHGSKYEYSFTTTERITTSSSKAKKGVGSGADVFVGVTQSMVSGKVKSVALINDSLYQLRKPAIDAGTMKLLVQGTDTDGQKYYLVTGEKVLLGSTISNSFIYSQHYVLGTVIPSLILERQNLLGHYDTEADAQARADALDQPVYRYIPESEKLSMTDTLANTEYKMFVPDNGETYTDEVVALDKMIRQWMMVIIANEKEKAAARAGGHLIGTWSVNYNNGFTHSDQFTSTGQYSMMPSKGFSLSSIDTYSKMTKEFLTTLLDRKTGFLSDFLDKSIGKNVTEAIKNYKKDESVKDESELGTKSNVSEFKMYWEPVFKTSVDQTQSYEKTNKKTQGFSLVSDSQGDITVSVYRVAVDSLWYIQNSSVNAHAGFDDDEDKEYGSYVFITRAGSSYCPHEDEEKTLFYNPGTLIHNATSWIAKPSMSINTFEQIGVPADGKATFRLELRNDGEALTGEAAAGTTFDLFLLGASNPNGAKVTVNGMNLMSPVSYFLTPGQSITQTIEVERGQVDDYDNLQLFFSVGDCPKTNTILNFSVHFLPESSPVALAAPRQGWVMNTLSPKDSVGYYLPIDINGFNIRHKNFDHIEFQYKLASQSDDDWTNMCSFYADDSLYNLASGNKAMIENGRITPFRFYGERDPMEQQYDLRAVSFCRHGSGFVTKSSPVISGTKDTRPPRVFGAPQPANAILGVGDDLKLRFNEAIAGNYLDEDNNFQLLGVTNATGITTGTSVHFDGSDDSYVASKVSRTLSGRSVTLDMLVKPATPATEAVFFSHGENTASPVLFGMKDNRLMLTMGNRVAVSKPLEPMLDFTRVIVTYNAETEEIRFYAGTLDVTENSNDLTSESLAAGHTVNTPLVFGQGFNGNMLEVRVWTKVLTPEEIAATHLRRLTGYERELAAYYPMNEGRGETLTDKANGATLYIHGAAWTNRSSISLRLDEGQRVQLNGNAMARSAVYDFTLMFWFKALKDGTLFSSDKFTITNNRSTLNPQPSTTNNTWHHYALSVNRAYNNASVFIDGEMVQTIPSDSVPGLTGAMYLGGDGFAGNIDEFALFEQALPKSLIEQYAETAPVGDEMGLMAYLPFCTTRQNAGGVMEQVFSVNDQRIFRDANGNVVEKQVPLVTGDLSSLIPDKTDYAPLRDHGQLTKLKFDWAFNDDELLINLNMADREINKQTVYVTVRDVEDLHGNPMPSPASWLAYVDRNSLKWAQKTLSMHITDDEADAVAETTFSNYSGKRHQFTLESLPAWLSVSTTYGSIEPTDEQKIRFTFNTAVPVGVYSDILYLTDENGLSEPLRVEYVREALCPYDEPDKGKYPMNMSICAQVVMEGAYATDAADRVIALFGNECVGMADLTTNDQSPITNHQFFLTVYGNDAMVRKELTFLLWQSSTGKVYNLTPNRQILFAHGYVYGCGDDTPLVFTTSGSETQNITLDAGWNWISTYLNVTSSLSTLNAQLPWTEGDVIKNPNDRQFSTYSEQQSALVGTLSEWDYTQMYMVYAQYGNTLRLCGEQLDEADKQISLRGDGQWNALPCLFNETTPLTEALADYYERASAGDLVKSHDRFAYFSSDKKWIGDLTALTPGEGYLMRRMGIGTVTVHFYDKPANAPRKVQSDKVQSIKEVFTNLKASTNMTMIAQMDIAESRNTDNPSLRAYIGDELVGVAHPISLSTGEGRGEALYFLTIQSDAIGRALRFETEDGTVLTPVSLSTGEGRGEALTYVPDAHHGSLKAPVMLTPDDELLTTKFLRDGMLFINHNGKTYTATGVEVK